MSVITGRRASLPTPDRARSDAAASSTGSRIPAPHFRPPTAAPVDAESLEEARRVVEDLRVHLAELEHREQSLNSQLTVLDREQRALRQQTQQFAADSAELQQLLERRERELDNRQQALESQQAEIDRQRETLRAETAAEIADARLEIEAVRAELARDRTDLADEIARRRSEMQTAAAQLATETIETKRALAEQQAEIERDRDQLRSELLEEFTSEHLQIAADRAEVERDRTQLEQDRAELADELARRDAERQREIVEHTALLAQLREEQLADVEAREADVTQREVDLVRRTKFQEEHLSRLRAAIEAKQADLERERAAKAVWSAEVDTSIRQRLAHLRKFRDLLEGREAACDAAWQTLADAQSQQQAMLVDLRMYVSDEQRALIEQQDAVAGDLRRHAELMRLREEELERRSARTDSFRDELSRRHFDLAGRETALLGARDWLIDQIGPEAVERLMPRDRTPSPVDSTVDQHRREIADAERALANWQHELQREREEFSQLTVDREQRLRERESSLAWQWEQLTAREAALQAAQLRDRAEREETLAVLESLVGQLEGRLTSATHEGSNVD